MQLTASMFLIVCPFIFLAGFVDAIAGGGGMISLPAYLIAGVPVHSALGTNKLSSMVGTCVSTIRYCRHGFVDWALAGPSMVAAVLGSLVGANLALLVTGTVLQVVLLVVLPLLAVYIFRNRSFESSKGHSLTRKQVLVWGTVITFFIGIFDGFYGPGTGTFLLILYTSVLGLDVKTASGNVKLANLSSNVAAFMTFLMHGRMVLLLGGVAALFSIAGHYAGSGMVMKNGTKVVRPIILVVIVLLYIKIIGEMIG
ncbi:hypothetical protein SAMN02910358_00825 [Lachnospiraceae bacterium XBB1006]|nr:hypothetical protein SAMN02910358_00825 [Lachnospiraceae bacterium XBB1006]